MWRGVASHHVAWPGETNSKVRSLAQLRTLSASWRGVVPQSVGPSWWPKTPAGSTQSGVVPRHQYKAGSVSVSCFILG